MLPRGSEPLIALRRAGKKPVLTWVNFGDFVEPDWWKWADTAKTPELLIRPEDPIERLDLRCVVGLSVNLFFADWNSKAARLFERLTEYVDEVAVMSQAFDEDIGWRWIKGIGRVEYGEAHYLTDLANAQADRWVAAKKGDSVAYAAAAAREKQIREAAPWLNC